MNRNWYLTLVGPLMVCFTLGCGNKSSNNTDGGASDGGSTAPLCSTPGCNGGACSKDSDCTEGNSAMTAVCWTSTLLNNTQYVTTPGGYCSRECESDSDCGTAKCIAFPSASKKYCMARCNSATTCSGRSGYSCAFDGDSGGICFPNGNFDCNPNNNEGTCEVGTDRYLGGCIRVAYESDHGGVCHLQCLVGTQTCPADSRSLAQPPPAQLCVYVDTTVDAQGNPTPNGDKFKGNLCFDQSPTPIQPGQACKYWTDCTDGYECDRYNLVEEKRVCRQLCAQGGAPTPPAGLYPLSSSAMPAGQTCSNAAEGCANSFNANRAMPGATGICQAP